MIISHRRVTSSDLKYERPDFRRSDSTFLQLVVVVTKGGVTETIRNDDFLRNAAWQHCCDIVSNGYNIVPTYQRCVARKIVVANRPV